MHRFLVNPERLTNADLLRRVEELAGRERQSTAELIGHLAELDKRKLYRGEGYASLFTYCTKALRLSEQAAYKRIVAARASRRFPALLDRLSSGSLNLSTLCLLVPVLTDDNHEVLLAEADERSKREVEALVARFAPKPDVPASVRKLPAPLPAAPALTDAGEASGLLVQASASVRSTSSLSELAAPPPASSLANRPSVVPLTPERYRIQFTVSRDTQDKLRRVQDLLRREIPNGDPAAIFERAITLVLEDVVRKKLAATTRPRRGHLQNPRSRHVPAELKRQVWLRDGGQCAFVARSGRRCGERALLEIHHLEPHAVGGETTLENLSLRCRSHNVYEAELLFGAFERANYPRG